MTELMRDWKAIATAVWVFATSLMAFALIMSFVEDIADGDLLQVYAIAVGFAYVILGAGVAYAHLITPGKDETDG
jgi:hypothetical protein